MAGWSVPGVVHLKVLREDPVGQRVLARHRLSRKSLAITYLSSELLAEADFRARFGGECAKLARVRDSRVSRVHRYVSCDRGDAVINDYVSGTTLRSLLLAEGALGLDAALVVFTEVLLGLAACHQAGVTHGDLTPEHVILTPAGRVRLVDPGLWGSAGRLQLARSTPFYLAPELWSDPAASRESGDVYAATATFFECLAGAPPFFSTEVAGLSAKHQRGELPLETIPEPARELVRRGLAKDPDPRADARDFAAFAGALASRAVGSGWESRGRAELSALLGAPARHGGCTSGTRAGARGYGTSTRLAAVMGGALALAVGLSSPPSVVISNARIFGAGARPPVLAFPEPDHGTAAVRMVTNRPRGERGLEPTAKVRTAGPVTGIPRPPSSIHGESSDIAEAQPAVHDEGNRGDASLGTAAYRPALGMPPACSQRLTNDHQPCIFTSPERPTRGSSGTPSNPSDTTFPVFLPIQLPPEVQKAAPLWPVRSTGRELEPKPGWFDKGVVSPGSAVAPEKQ